MGTRHCSAMRALKRVAAPRIILPWKPLRRLRKASPSTLARVLNLDLIEPCGLVGLEVTRDSSCRMSVNL